MIRVYFNLIITRNNSRTNEINAALLGSRLLVCAKRNDPFQKAVDIV